MPIKLIKHTGECDHPDDPSLPVKLELYMRVPEFMVVAFVAIHGGVEQVIARGDTVAEVESWMKEHGLDSHPRLQRFRITLADVPVRDHNWK